MNLIFLDTETTSKNDGRLVQLAYEVADREFNAIFKPPVPIEFGAMATHHITNRMVENAHDFDDRLRAHVQADLDNNILVAHNAPFDIAVLEREGLTVPRWIDTLKLAQTLWDEPEYKLQYLRYRFDLQLPTVEITAHDAASDILVLKYLFSYIINAYRTQGESDDDMLARMEATSKAPLLLRRIGFGKHRGTAFAELPTDYLQWLQKQNDIDPDLAYTLEYYLNLCPKLNPPVTPPTPQQLNI